MISLRFYFLHIKWDLFILTSGCVLLQAKIHIKMHHSLLIYASTTKLSMFNSFLFVPYLASQWCTCDVIWCYKHKKHKWGVVFCSYILSNKKSHETFHVYSQKSLSFITLISKTIMFTWWTFYFSFYQRYNSMQYCGIFIFRGDQCLLLSCDTPTNEFAYQQTYKLSLV